MAVPAYKLQSIQSTACTPEIASNIPAAAEPSAKPSPLAVRNNPIMPPVKDDSAKFNLVAPAAGYAKPKASPPTIVIVTTIIGSDVAARISRQIAARANPETKNLFGDDLSIKTPPSVTHNIATTAAGASIKS